MAGYQVHYRGWRKRKYFKKPAAKDLTHFQQLPYHDHYLNTPVEPMHLCKNIAEHVAKLLSGLSDTEKVRNEEKDRNRLKKYGFYQRPHLKE